MKFREMSAELLQTTLAQLQTDYRSYLESGLRLDMSRGKPSPAQLDLSSDLLTVPLLPEDFLTRSTKTDIRNYGVLDGFAEIKELMADVLQVGPESVLVGGNSSLNLMYDYLIRAMMFGVYGSERPWGKEERVKFICLVPGYDRHFAVTEQLGFELISVDLFEDGPDVDAIEKLVAADPAVKGMWCVPKFSNPSGTVYSDAKVRRLAALKPAARDFRIIWDNAYNIHFLDAKNPVRIPDILAECAAAGNEHMPIVFGSTSKVTFPGGGISALAASPENLAHIKKYMTVQTIGHDKMNMMRHVKFFKNSVGLEEQMKRQAELLAPKFRLAADYFNRELVSAGVAEFLMPRGGYFILLTVPNGCAKLIVERCRQAGLVLTDAGATHPYKSDPNDNAIRIAPSFPECDELELAMRVLCTVVRLTAAEKLLEEKRQA